jgi:hypothetical protein
LRFSKAKAISKVGAASAAEMPSFVRRRPSGAASRSSFASRLPAARRSSCATISEKSDRASDQSRQQIAHPDIAGGKSNFDESRVHANRRRGDADVGGERESAPRSGAVDQRNDRLRTTAHRQNDLRKPSLEEQDRFDVIARIAIKVLDIEPGAKCASGAGQHDHPHRFVEQ